MKNDDISYEEYEHYYRNKYLYPQHLLFPVAVIVEAVILISLLKYILIAIAIISVITVAVIILYCYLKKQLNAEQYISLTKEDAKEGVEANINVSYASQRVSFVFNIPPNVKDGQKFVAKNIHFKNKKGKTVNKNVHFRVKVT